GHGLLTEKALNLDVARRLKDLLTARGATVYMSRCRDVALSHVERAALSNAVHPDVFLSIHENASRDRTADGTQTEYLTAPGHALANYLLGTYTLPALWQTLSSRMALPSNGVQQREL